MRLTKEKAVYSKLQHAKQVRNVKYLISISFFGLSSDGVWFARPPTVAAFSLNIPGGEDGRLQSGGARNGVLDAPLHYHHRSASGEEVGPTCVSRRVSSGPFTTHRRLFFIWGSVRIAANFRFGSSNCNQLPTVEEAEEKARIATDCVVSFARGRDFRTTHAATLQVTQTRRTAVSLRFSCLIAFRPHYFTSLAIRLVASARARTGG